MLPPSEALDATELLPTEASARADTPRRAGAFGAADPGRAAASPRRGVGWPLKRSHAIAGAGALIALLLIVIIAANSGGGQQRGVTRTTPLQPAPAGAPVNQQLDQLERIVRAAPRKR